MKTQFLSILTLTMALFFSGLSEAAKESKKETKKEEAQKDIKINCQDYSKEADQLKESASKKQKELELVEKQLKSNTKAAEDYNKNCRKSSQPNCNPAMYSMISGQISVLTGQQQKLTTEIMDAKSKQDAALENLQSCKEAVKKRKI